MQCISSWESKVIFAAAHKQVIACLYPEAPGLRAALRQY